MGKPTPEQLARINQLARSPLTEDQVYVFSAKLIGDNPIPNRFMQVTPNFLRKMAEDAKQGVSLMLDHSWASWGAQLALPYGRTFDATLKQEPDGELALYADHYMLRGQTLNGISTDDLISAIDAGTMFDTSIGYQTTKNICSLDGLDYFGGICPHYRGQSYDGQVCNVYHDDGSLMENSLVFDGAYPGAGVVAASKQHNEHEHKTSWVLQEGADASKKAENILFSFSQKSGLRTFVKHSQSEPEGDDSVNELEQAQQQLSAANGILASVREALGVQDNAAIQAALSAVKGKAELGSQFANRVIEEACAAGVRALGEAFNVESMKLSFSHLSVGDVEKIRDTYNAQAKAALGGGGQHVATAGSDLPAGGAAPSNSQATSETLSPEDARKAAREALARNGYKQLLKDGE